jgi:alpha-tubulin suppressor-like RCC1 family protein
MWGNNGAGQLGTNDVIKRSSPIQTVSAGTNWKQVSCGQQHVGAIKTDGTLWMWGRNDTGGQLGTNDTTSRSSPVQTVSGGNNWKQVSGGLYHTAAIKTDGTLWIWGNNGLGELGDNSRVSKSSPIQTVTGGNNWKQVWAGNGNTAAIKTDGTLWLWGGNGWGQLGTNDTNSRSSPIQTVAGGNNWKQVSGIGRRGFTNATAIAAIKTDGTLWMWGINTNGELGTNDRTSRSSPIQTVTGGTNWKQVSGGAANIAAIKTDGTLWLWGDGSYGALGTNDTTPRSSPIQTVATGGNWKQVGFGSDHCFAIYFNDADSGYPSSGT